MGEPLYRAGPPTGLPDTSRYWAGEGPFVHRINLAADAGRARIGFAPAPAVTGTDPAAIVEQLRSQYLRGPLELTSRAALEALAASLPTTVRVEQTLGTILVTPNFLVH
jgi:hypothetical protein